VTIYCINPKCKQREHSDDLTTCPACGTSLVVKNRYLLRQPLRSLNSLGYAEVFEVEDLGAEVIQGERYKVLKTLKRENSTVVRLFKQEAQTLANLNHPGIPSVELADGYFTLSLPKRSKPLHCLVMEKIEGQNLQTWIENNGRIAETQALEWLKQLLEILDHLHASKYLHRDIKPSNIMLRPDGQLVLIDLGTIRRITETFMVRLGVKSGDTATGIVSPGYSAPEQINGRVVPQSDLYALGRTFVYLLTQKHPLDLGESDQGRLLWRNEADQVSDLLGDWLDHLMLPYPWQRPTSTTDVLNHLKEGLSPPPIRKPAPTWLIALNFIIFSAVLTTGLLWYQSQGESRPQALPQISLQQTQQ
jgi:serine/threonine protein kinase